MKLSRVIRDLSIVIPGVCLLAPFASVAHRAPRFPGAQDAVAGPSWRVESPSEKYDFTMRLLKPCLKDDAPCAGPGQLRVQRKGSRRVLQILNLPHRYFYPGAEAHSSPPDAPAISKMGITPGDFNFDGHEDLAIENGMNAGYGGISYDIYLFDPIRQRFFRSKAMSELASRQMLFEVDANRKLLTSWFKSGCCYQMEEKYRVVKNVPVPVERHIEELTAENKKKITDEKKVGGRWRATVRFEAFDAAAD
ncbi:MAG: XAC2610-related protein [Janthinobacterium lividum]